MENNLYICILFRRREMYFVKLFLAPALFPTPLRESPPRDLFHLHKVSLVHDQH